MQIHGLPYFLFQYIMHMQQALYTKILIIQDSKKFYTHV